MLENVFQYTKDLTIRQKLFKVYIAPIIECYLPAYLSYKYDRRHDLAIFQQKCLTSIIRVNVRCPVEKVDAALCERSILEKTYLIALRLESMLGRGFTAESSQNLRGGRSQAITINGGPFDNLDFCHRIVRVVHELKDSEFPLELGLAWSRLSPGQFKNVL